MTLIRLNPNVIIWKKKNHSVGEGGYSNSQDNTHSPQALLAWAYLSNYSMMEYSMNLFANHPGIDKV